MDLTPAQQAEVERLYGLLQGPFLDEARRHGITVKRHQARKKHFRQAFRK
jgi:hypothetical protein